MIVARHIRVTGKVQGVFFRSTTQQEARALGVHGWVRNCEDGSVEAHLEGGKAAVDTLVDRLRVGPPGAKVENVAVEDARVEEHEGFEIRR